MKPFRRMGHVGIQVDDIARAVAFYRDQLGFDVEWNGDEDWANVSLGGDDLGLILKSRNKHPPHLGLRVETQEELRLAHAGLKARGVDVEPIRGHRDGSQSFYFRDPDGHVLEGLWLPSKKPASRGKK
jgi:catechol 2,3-dioxygenase-like lactoylglutathione lyase family enzyme